MAKKGLLVLALMVFITGMAFAEPRNALSVDIGPTIVGFSVGAIGNMITDDDLFSSGFGIAAQYERYLSSSLSLAFRFAYLGFRGGGSSNNDTLYMDFTSWSAEGNVRLFPFSDPFFLNAMVGFASLSTDFSGSAVTNNFSVDRNYIKLGGLIGWHFVLGDGPGGLFFEPSFGWAFGIRLGDPVGDVIAANTRGGTSQEFEDAYRLAEQFVLIGGPRVRLAFGWRF